MKNFTSKIMLLLTLGAFLADNSAFCAAKRDKKESKPAAPKVYTKKLSPVDRFMKKIVDRSYINKESHKIDSKTFISDLQALGGLDIQDSRGNTALITAAECFGDETVSALIEAGARVNILNNKNRSALYLVVLDSFYSPDCYEQGEECAGAFILDDLVKAGAKLTPEERSDLRARATAGGYSLGASAGSEGEDLEALPKAVGDVLR